MTRSWTRPEVLVLGAGPAGSMASAQLARGGRHVVCLEREWFPRYALGESLLPRCNELLAEAGLLEAVEARGYEVKRGVTFERGGQQLRLCFRDGLPDDPPSTFHVPRDDFDRTLASAARRLGADVRFGQEVESLVPGPDAVEATVRDVETGERRTVRAPFLLDCSGYGRVVGRLLGFARPPLPVERSAFFTMVEGDRRPDGEPAGDLFVHLLPAGGWAWAIPFSDGRTSVGVVAAEDCLPAEGHPRERMLAHAATSPVLARRLSDAVPVQPLRSITRWPASMERLHGRRWAVAGNAGEFLDPVFSSGVCLALEFSALAARLVEETLDGGEPDWERTYTAPVQRALATFRFFVQAWYGGALPALFFGGGLDPQLQRAITSALGGNVLKENPVLEPFVAQAVALAAATPSDPPEAVPVAVSDPSIADHEEPRHG